MLDALPWLLDWEVTSGDNQISPVPHPRVSGN